MKSETMYTVYILRSLKDGNYYIGCTSEIHKRVKQHNQGRVRSTKYRMPLSLVYAETHENKYDAYNREKYYKTARGKKELKARFLHSGIV